MRLGYHGFSRAGFLRWCVGVAAVAAYVAAFLRAAASPSYDLVGGLALGPLIALAWGYIAHTLGARELDPSIRRLVVLSAYAKMAACLVIYWVSFDVYSGAADAQLYHESGEVIASQFRGGDFDIDLGRRAIGTGFMQLLAGALYTLIGPTKLGAFLVFAMLGWLGTYLFFRAFVVGVPSGAHRSFAALVFLMPSILFWPSTFGKESWMLLSLGAASYGISRILRGSAGLSWLAAGLVGAVMMRPHMGLIILAGVAGTLVGSGRSSRGLRGFGRPFVVAVLLVAVALVAPRVESFFAITGLDANSVDDVLNRVGSGTSRGGSQFTNVGATSPVELPYALVSVAMRPFPWEVHNLQALLASLEGVALVVIFWRRRRSFRGLLHSIRSTPYVAYAACYSLVFVAAFSHLNNLGLLARERTQLFPLLLVIAALPPYVGRSRARSSGVESTGVPAVGF